MNAPDGPLLRQLALGKLLGLPARPCAANDPNRGIFASLLAGSILGQGSLPPRLGLEENAFEAMSGLFFPGLPTEKAGRLLTPLPETEELKALFERYRAGRSPAEAWVADILIVACRGTHHLWQDLGLAHRGELTQLMEINFPALAQANSANMKWKKFIYRQLCAEEGIYVCPAPSCSACKDHAQCFGSES